MGPVTESKPDPADPRPAVADHAGGFSIDVSGDEELDRALATLEMAGEEAAIGFHAAPHKPLAPEVRFLHCSRTIHELITDRNRSVGIFLFVASVLFAASTALLNARPVGPLIVPLGAIQYWSLPVTFGTLAVIGVFVTLILTRTRVGLIYEVSKMNALLGLPSGRVKRVNPFSIFFLMHGLVVLLGAASAGLASGMLAGRNISATDPAGVAREVAGSEPAIAVGLGVSAIYLALFEALYFLLISRATTDAKLSEARGRSGVNPHRSGRR